MYSLQVAPKPLTSAAQVVTTTQTQQRLIMPATPLPQIQPNFTNLPPGTVLAPAPGGGNVGYAVVPAQYVTQVSGVLFQTLLLSGIHCTCAEPSLSLCSLSSVAPAVTFCDPRQQLWFPCTRWYPDSGQTAAQWVRGDNGFLIYCLDFY